MFRSRRIRLVLVAALIVVAVVALPGVVVPGVLACAPALLLLGCLWLGRYPGQERIVRWMSRRRRPRRRAAIATTPTAFAPARAACPRGGRLLGSQLAVRPPPAAVAATVG